MKWNELYTSEQELLDDMMKAKSDETVYYHYQLVKGYIYIESFKRYYVKHGNLTPKQLTQLKRCANEIYKNTHCVRV